MNSQSAVHRQLQQALIEAFPDRHSLAQMVRFGLGVNLNEIAAEGNLRQTVFELIEWAAEQDQIDQLVAAAQTENPGNAALQAVADQVDLLSPAVPLRPAFRRLPIPLTPFIGREVEVARACALLRRPEVRILTLCGPGGSGKTRLGLQVAADIATEFPAGVCFVALSTLTDPDLVPSTIASALGVKEIAGQPLDVRLQVYLADKQLLLVLDNFEQVIEAASAVSDLLESVSPLKILVTSRMRLRIGGERVFTVLPLAVPSAAQERSVADLQGIAAVRFFVIRANDVDPGFTLSAANGATIAEICRRLDGLPLALELAAARIAILSPAELLARLTQSIWLLRAGSRDLAPHQQALWATIDWSYALLNAGAQRLLRRLAVFVGGCRLDAAEAICGEQEVADATSRNSANAESTQDMLDELTALVDINLLYQVVGADGGRRFRMLDTIHAYARELLDASGEAEALQEVHTHYYLQLAEAAFAAWQSAEYGAWLQRVEAELDNLRAVLQRAIARCDGTVAARLAIALWEFMRARGYLREGRTWLEAALAQPGLSRRLRAGGFMAAGLLAQQQGDVERAKTCLHESLQLHRKLRNKSGVAHALNNLGLLACDEGQYNQARAFYEESLALFRQVGNKWGTALLLNNLGTIAQVARDYPQAYEFYESSLALHRELDNRQGCILALVNLGESALDQGDLARAEHRYYEGLLLCKEVGEVAQLAYCLEGLAGVASGQDDPERAAQLLGAAEALRETTGAVLTPFSRPAYERTINTARAQTDEASWSAAWAAGRAMTTADAIAYATKRVAGGDAT